jgi:parallel beta-helix repeat protein
MFRGWTLFLFLTLSLVRIASAKSFILYVATNGNDGWSGRLEKPTRDGQDGPLATLPAALKAARLARQSSVKSFDRTTIFLRGGTYSITEPIALGPEDSGRSANQPLMVAAYRKEKPVLSGGRRITGWKKIEGKSGWWQAAVPEVREGKWRFRQLFINGQRKRRARSPSVGYFQADGEYLNLDPIQLKYHNGDIKKEWVGSGVELIALHKWIDLRQYIRGLDETNHAVTLSGALAPHVKEANARYYIENAPDALDEPGEWYLDRKTGLLTYWAEMSEDLSRAEVIAPVLNSELVHLQADFSAKKPVQHVVLRGLTFAHTDWSLPENGYLDSQAAVHVRGDVLAEGAVDCVVDNCVFAHLGGYALELGKGCQRCHVFANEIFDIGAGGIRIGETAKRTDAFEMNHGHVVGDNHLHQLGRVYAPAIGLIIFQSGQNRVAHNHIHDLYYTAISVGWNWGYQETPCHDNVIEFNHLHDIGQGVLSDMGGIYTLGIQKGTILRNNLIHDVRSDSYGGWGLYTDEGSTDIVLENNVVYRCKSAGFHQHYGRENIIRNNIFAYGTEHQLMRSREEEHLSFFFTNNIVYFATGTLLGSTWKNDRFVMDNNVYWNVGTGASASEMRLAGATLEEWRKRGHDLHSTIADPLFVAPEKYDFRLLRNSPVLKLGFKPIDLSEVGVRGKFRKQVHDTD